LFGTALERLAVSYELDRPKREDLLQEIHLNLWRSFASFDGRCSLRTWVYRVAHNVAGSHVMDAQRRRLLTLVPVEALDTPEFAVEPEAGRGVLLDQLLQLVQRLRPLDRELVVLYLEGLNAVEIGQIVGLSQGNVATKISRIKKLLSRLATEGRNHGQ
jgi:RNA polymerase sigma-70 factor (ECF subfamily)